MGKRARSLSESITENIQNSAHAVAEAGQEAVTRSSNAIQNSAHVIAEAGQEAVTRSSNAIQYVLHYDQLPQWMKVDTHIKRGYRPQLGSYRHCFWSLFYLHNESINIWSHLLPAICYLALLLKLDVETIHSGIKIRAIDKAVFQLYVVCTVGCLLLSAIYHGTNSHSEHISRCFLKLDYLGIVLHVVGTNISAAYFGLHGHPLVQSLYILFLVVCAARAFYLLLRNDIDGPGAVLQRYTILHLCHHIS